MKLKILNYSSSIPSAVAAVSDDIRDIRGPIHIPYPWLWVVYVLGGLIVCALLIWAYRYWKKRRNLVPVKLPHEIAMERLQEALPLMQEGSAREFSIAVSNAIRFYIEDRFNLRAARHTTEEFLRDLLSSSESAVVSHKPALENFLEHCDLAKFARWSLSTVEMKEMFESAKKFVEETKPKPPSKAPAKINKSHPPVISEGRKQ